MRFIPTQCEVCLRPSLVAASDIHEGVASCTQCGGRANVLPGESYGESDVALFAELARTLREAGITPSQAAQLATELDARSLLPPGRSLRRLVQTLPSLRVLEPLDLSEPSALRKTEGMLATLLDVMARARSASGISASGVLPNTRVGGQ